MSDRRRTQPLDRSGLMFAVGAAVLAVAACVLIQEWQYAASRAGLILLLATFLSARRYGQAAGYVTLFLSTIGAVVVFVEPRYGLVPASVAGWASILWLLALGSVAVWTGNRLQQAARSNTLLRSISATTTDLIFAKDRQGRITFANPATLALFGRSASEVVGHDDMTLHADAEQARLLRANDLRVMGRGEAEVFEEALDFPDGTRRIFLSSKAPYRDARGRVIGVVGVARDVTERARAEHRLTAEHAVSRVLADAYSIEDALPAVLHALAEHLGARTAALWLPDAAGEQLYCAEFKILPPENEALLRFADHTRTMQFPRGSGLPGRAWAAGEFEILRDMGAKEIFPRASVVEGTNLRVGLAFPIRLGGENLGVIELLGDKRLEVDDALLSSLGVIATQIGQFIQRKELEEAVRRWRGVFDDGTWSTARIEPSAVDSTPLAETPAPKYLTMSGQTRRLQYLQLTETVDVSPEASLDRLTDLVCRLLKVPVSLVSLAEDYRLLFSYQDGLATPKGTSSEVTPLHALCRTVIEREEPLVMSDARANPVVLNYPSANDILVGSYLGVPIKTVTGSVVGALCAIDSNPRAWTADDLFAMRELAALAMTEILMRNELTARRAAEAEIREREERFRKVIENAPIPMLARKANGGVLFVNAEWTRVTGYTIQDIPTYERWIELAFREEAPALLAEIITLTAEGREMMGREFQVWTKDGRRRTLQLFSAPVGRMPDGDWLRAVAALDMTERLEVEAALREADRRKDEFLATLAHELRNPLAPVRNAIELMALKPPNDPSQARYRELIDRQISHLARLVDDLMDVSRISRGKLTLQRSRVPLEIVVRDAVDTARPLIDASKHRLEVKLPAESVLVDGDLTRLSQVLGNLLTNAAKYTPPGGDIWVTAERHGREVRISVRDTGIGIAADDLPRVFEMFSQVDTKLTRSHGGLGIGLALARGLVEMHGGTLEARSEGPGKGSEFIVTLPIAIPSSPPDADATPNADGDRFTQPLRLLVVDDNTDAADSFAIVLQAMGHEVRVAYDGEHALEAAREFCPHVVVLDIGMPGIDGYETCRKMRAQEWARDVIFVAQTGWGQESDRRRSREAGFDHHLVKPVRASDLLAALRDGAAVHP